MQALVYSGLCKSLHDSVVDPAMLDAEENTEVKLPLVEPGTGGPYHDIIWYKGEITSSNRIVQLSGDISTAPQYFNEYCPEGSNTCETSHRGKLNVETGEFIIYNGQLGDEDYYYYYFYIKDGTPDTGNKYETDLTVYGKSEFKLLS